MHLSPNTEQGIDQMKDILKRTRKATATPTMQALAMRMKWLFLDESSLADELLETRFRIFSQPGHAEAIRKLTERTIGGLSSHRVLAGLRISSVSPETCPVDRAPPW